MASPVRLRIHLAGKYQPTNFTILENAYQYGFNATSNPNQRLETVMEDVTTFMSACIELDMECLTGGWPGSLPCRTRFH